MPTEIFEDQIELEASTLEAVYPTSENSLSCYPYPALRLTGRSSRMAFRALILENALLRATVIPDLGGRILSLFDKRTGVEVLHADGMLEAAEGGPRGVRLDAGILLEIGTAGRTNSLGPIEYVIRDQVEEGESPYLVLHELIAGIAVSWHATLTLPDDRAELHLSVKTLNRTLLPVRCWQGVAGWLADGQPRVQSGSSSLYSERKRAGFSVHYMEPFFEAVEGDSGALSLWRSSEHSLLTPRQSDTWTVVIQPISALPTLDGWSSEVSLSLEQGQLAVQAATSRPGSKILVETHSGESFEAKADLYPEKATTIDVSSMPELAGIAVRDAEGNDLLLADLKNPPEPLKRKALGLSARSSAVDALGNPAPESREGIALQGIQDGEPDKMALGLAVPGLQAACRTALGMEALRQGGHEEALVWLEDAIGCNAEDHLLWWLKATIKRMHGLEEEEDQDLPTAHFLAPLEPVLRGESFLRLPQTHGKEPNPIVKPLASHPEALIEVACLLLEAGLDEEAMRWMDEARRHRDEPMLRYLQAWSLITKTRMAVEAAELVRGCSARPLQPPYPWRTLERAAIRELAERFAADERLAQLSRMSGAALGSLPP